MGLFEEVVVLVKLKKIIMNFFKLFRNKFESFIILIVNSNIKGRVFIPLEKVFLINRNYFYLKKNEFIIKKLF